MKHKPPRHEQTRPHPTPVFPRPRHVQRAYDVYEDAPFFDERIRKRVLQVAIDKMARPAPSFSRSSRTHARAKAAYRLVGNYKLKPDQKRQERVTQEQLWTPIFEHAARTSRDAPLIYSIQDSCCLMYPTLKATQGLGTADREKEEALWMHSALGVQPDGYVLGLYDAEFWARPLEEFGKSADAPKRPFQDKESYLWVQAADRVESLFERMGLDARRVVHVADRAGDVHEVMQHFIDTHKRFIIRFAHNRKIEQVEGGEPYVRPHLFSQPVLETQAIPIPRTKAHPKRQATVQVRACRVTLHPSHSTRAKRPFSVNVVSIYEPDPPAGVERIDWILYTSEPIDTAPACWCVVDGYKLRWRIEDYHRALKTDGYAERTQLKQADSIVRLLAFVALAAIRILQLRERARTNPTEPCTTLLEDHEWKVLWLVYYEDLPEPGQPPPTIAQAVKMIGSLGGHLGRRGDGMPGSDSISLGLRELETATNVYRLLGVEL